MKKIIFLALGGAAGTVLRYWVSGFVQRSYRGGFPVGTLAVNIAGCFLFGLVWSLAEERLVVSGQLRAMVLVGFMGAFTTFSTFAFETGELLRDAQWTLASFNLLAQNISGIIFLYIGLARGRLL